MKTPLDPSIDGVQVTARGEHGLREKTVKPGS